MHVLHFACDTEAGLCTVPGANDQPCQKSKVTWLTWTMTLQCPNIQILWAKLSQAGSFCCRHCYLKLVDWAAKSMLQDSTSSHIVIMPKLKLLTNVDEAWRSSAPPPSHAPKQHFSGLWQLHGPDVVSPYSLCVMELRMTTWQRRWTSWVQGVAGTGREPDRQDQDRGIERWYDSRTDNLWIWNDLDTRGFHWNRQMRKT